MSMPSTPPYSLEFRREAVRLLRTSGRSLPQLAEELGCWPLRGPRRPRLSRRGAPPPLGRGHHLPADVGGLAVPRRGARRLSRRIVGWSMADHMRTELVTDALQMALARRRPQPGLICDSDQGSQFVSLAFGQQARATGIAQSMGSKG